MIVFKSSPDETRLGSLVQTQDDLKVPERLYTFNDLATSIVPNVVARYLKHMHRRLVMKVRSRSQSTHPFVNEDQLDVETEK